MKQRRPEVADVLRRYGEAYHAVLSTAQARVMKAIQACRTAALGGHVEICDECGHRRIWYNSCRNRHCNKCQSLARAQWIQKRLTELLDTSYFHIVLTLPEQIAAIAFYNKRVVYNISVPTASLPTLKCAEFWSEWTITMERTVVRYSTI